MRYDAKYILDEIRSVYGGSMEMRKGKENQNDSWCLVISGKKKLTILLNDILPYLILKKDIAELIHEYASMTNIHPLYRSNYEELDARRTEIFKLTKAITKKGKRVATTN